MKCVICLWEASRIEREGAVWGGRFKSDSRAIQGRFDTFGAIRRCWHLCFGAIRASPLDPFIILKGFKDLFCRLFLHRAVAGERASLEFYNASFSSSERAPSHGFLSPRPASYQNFRIFWECPPKHRKLEPMPV